MRDQVAGRRRSKLVMALVGVVALAVLFAMLRPNRDHVLGFGYVSHSVSSNVTSVTIVVTNNSSTAILYLPAAAQIATNNVYSLPTLPLGNPMWTLPGGQVVQRTFSVTNVSDRVRLPVFWSFDWKTPSNFGFELYEDLKEVIRARRYGYPGGGMGAIYTNYFEVPLD